MCHWIYLKIQGVKMVLGTQVRIFHTVRGEANEL